MSRILIIEDDAPLREVLATILTNAGHTVTQATEGRQGCAVFHAAPTDLVLTDLIMPGQEGIETIVQLRRSHPHLPIIAMSGGTTHAKSYLAIAAKLGANRTLPKPFTPAQLLRTIAEVLAETTSPAVPPSK